MQGHVEVLRIGTLFCHDHQPEADQDKGDGGQKECARLHLVRRRDGRQIGRGCEGADDAEHKYQNQNRKPHHLEVLAPTDGVMPLLDQEHQDHHGLHQQDQGAQHDTCFRVLHQETHGHDEQHDR